MKKCRNIFFLLFLVLLCTKGFSQELRVDFKKFNSEMAKQKTNGDRLNFIENEVSIVQNLYGKKSKEFVALKEFYFTELDLILDPNYNFNQQEYNLYVNDLKELLNLCSVAFGENSIEYARILNTFIRSRVRSRFEPIIYSEFESFSKLLNKGMDISNKMNENIQLDALISTKIALLKKANQRDSALNYYQIEYDHIIRHSLNNRITSFLLSYASYIGRVDSKREYDFLIDNEPLVRNLFYISDKPQYFLYLTGILQSALRENLVFDKTTMSYFTLADSICNTLYSHNSYEQILFSLNYKIPSLKKMGWKSLVYQELAYISEYSFKKNEVQLRKSSNFYLQYFLEWHDYYQSVGDYDSAFKILSSLEDDIRNSFSNDGVSFPQTLAIYRDLSDYYFHFDKDAGYYYSLKVLELEKTAKSISNDYVIHQYSEIAKQMVNFKDTGSISKAEEYCLLALNEFKNAYGESSDYYKSSQFTLGRIKFITSNGKLGLSDMWPYVYSHLNDHAFVPPLGTSVFQVYAAILNKVNKPDSADFFYNQIYLRNNAAQLFRVLGTSEDYQLKALQDIYSQNFLILTQHFQRFKKHGYEYVSSRLAETLFKKNLIYQFESYINEAIVNSTSEDDKRMVERVEQDRAVYDSLLYSGSTDYNLIDSAYRGLDLDKNWLLQSYVMNNSMDSTKLADLKREYLYSGIRNNLKNDECFIDIVRFLLNDKDTGFSQEPYYAIVLIDKANKDKLKYLFIEDGLNFERTVLEGNLIKVSSHLSPLIERLQGYKKIYVSPDGAFNLLNFYSLKDENEEYLIKNKTFVYVNTINGIIEPIDKPQNNNVATFFGNPLFNNKSTFNTAIQRNTVFPFDAFNNFRELPYSKIEIESASETLKNKGWKTKQYIGAQCNEEQLKKEMAPGILHISTHGFYISESDIAKNNFAFKSNPYLKSGLILGAVGNNGKTLNDNVLTAYEVMDMNLKNTSLVVLSACESAKGEIKPGQGIYGLQRAFKIAGAKNVLVSVRNVDDKATQILMQYFYENVAAGDPYTTALRNAQLQMLKHPLFNDPKYWSNFILIGQ